jgi:hypothetical protein
MYQIKNPKFHIIQLLSFMIIYLKITQKLIRKNETGGNNQLQKTNMNNI